MTTTMEELRKIMTDLLTVGDLDTRLLKVWRLAVRDARHAAAEAVATHEDKDLSRMMVNLKVDEPR